MIILTIPFPIVLKLRVSLVKRITLALVFGTGIM
jgi:hypothetical protein